MTSREFLFMDAYPEPTDDNEETAPVAPGCPDDTNGDGDCGKLACPNCGKYRLNVNVTDTPQPQRRVDLYQRKNEISDRFTPRD
jgi:hypothetical protein